MSPRIPLRWCLAAYPPRWRALRAREVADFLAEAGAAEPAPGRRAAAGRSEVGGASAPAGPSDAAAALRVPVREAAGLVRGGIATRLRTGPPLRTRAAYRMLDTRIPARYRGWVHDERTTVLGAVGEWMWSAFAFVVVAAAFRLPSFAVVALVMLLVVLVRRALLDDRHRAKHLVPLPDEPPTAWDLAWVSGPRRRWAARAALGWIVVGLAVATAAAVTVVLAAPGHLVVRGCGRACVEMTDLGEGGPGPLAAGFLGGAALLGAAAAAIGAKRLRGHATVLPEQPHRVVVPSGVVTALLVVLALTPLLVLLGMELSGAPALAYLVAVPGLVVLPVLTVALVVLRAHGSRSDALALVDVVAALRGRTPEVDTPRTCAVPRGSQRHGPDDAPAQPSAI